MSGLSHSSDFYLHNYLNECRYVAMVQPFHSNIPAIRERNEIEKEKKIKLNGVTTFNVCQIERHSLINECEYDFLILFPTVFSRLLIFI